MSARGSSRSLACVIATWPATAPPSLARIAHVEGRASPSRTRESSIASGGGSNAGPAHARNDWKPSQTVSVISSASSTRAGRRSNIARNGT